MFLILLSSRVHKIIQIVKDSMNNLSLIQLIQSLIFKLKLQLSQLPPPEGSSNRERLFYAAVKNLGTDASPNDVAPDEYGCVESVACIFRQCFGYSIGEELSTYRLYEVLRKSPLWTLIPISAALRGDLILSPSGLGNGTISGHTGYIGENGLIMSNDSATGLFSTKYDLKKWLERYQQKGGMPVFCFRKV